MTKYFYLSSNDVLLAFLLVLINYFGYQVIREHTVSVSVIQLFYILLTMVEVGFLYKHPSSAMIRVANNVIVSKDKFFSKPEMAALDIASIKGWRLTDRKFLGFLSFYDIEVHYEGGACFIITDQFFHTKRLRKSAMIYLAQNLLN